MNVTEQARRADALFYGNVSRRELCRMVARAESERDEWRRVAEELRKIAAEMRDMLDYMEPLVSTGFSKRLHDLGVR